MPWTKLYGEVLGEMDGSCFGCGVAKGGIVAEMTDANAGDRGSYDDAGGGLLCGFCLEEGRESETV